MSFLLGRPPSPITSREPFGFSKSLPNQQPHQQPTMASFYDRQSTRTFVPLTPQTPSTSLQKAISSLLLPIPLDGTLSCQYLLSIPGLPRIYKGGHSKNVSEAQNLNYNKCNYETCIFFATKPSPHPARIEAIRHLLSHEARRRERICNGGLGCGAGGHIEFYDFGTREALETHLRITFLLMRFMESAPYVPRRTGNSEKPDKVGELVLSEFWLGLYGKWQPSDVAELSGMLEEGLKTDRATLRWEELEVERLGRMFDQNLGVQEERSHSTGVGSDQQGSREVSCFILFMNGLTIVSSQIGKQLQKVCHGKSNPPALPMKSQMRIGSQISKLDLPKTYGNCSLSPWSPRMTKNRTSKPSQVRTHGK